MEGRLGHYWSLWITIRLDAKTVSLRHSYSRTKKLPLAPSLSLSKFSNDLMDKKNINTHSVYPSKN